MAPVLNPEEYVKVTLVSNASGALKIGPDGFKVPAIQPMDPLTVAWNSRETKLYVDQPSIVQLEAAVNAFGDPRSEGLARNVWLGEPGNSERLFIPDRASEVRRLRARYAIDVGSENSFYDWNGRDSLAPKVKMETLDGQEIVTVLDDPLGETVTAAVQTVNQQQDSANLIAHLQAQIDALTALIQGSNSAVPTSLASLPQDTDTGQMTQTIPPMEPPSDPPQPEDVINELPPD